MFVYNENGLEDIFVKTRSEKSMWWLINPRDIIYTRHCGLKWTWYKSKDFIVDYPAHKIENILKYT